MGKSRKRRRKLAAVVTAATAVTMLWTVSAAQATQVTPSGDNYTATAGVTTFISNNGVGVDVTCNSATATGTVPGAGGAYTYNRLSTVGGTPDVANGSVIGPIHSLSFSGNCRISQLGITGVVVDANNSSQGYTLTASAEHTDLSDDAAVAINLPGDAVDITVPAPLTCNIITPNDQSKPVAASVVGTFTNGVDGTPATPSVLSVTGQLPFGGSCLATGIISQGVFFADGGIYSGITTSTFNVVNTTDANSAIKIIP